MNNHVEAHNHLFSDPRTAIVKSEFPDCEEESFETVSFLKNENERYMRRTFDPDYKTSTPENHFIKSEHEMYKSEKVEDNSASVNTGQTRITLPWDLLLLSENRSSHRQQHTRVADNRRMIYRHNPGHRRQYNRHRYRRNSNFRGRNMGGGHRSTTVGPTRFEKINLKKKRIPCPDLLAPHLSIDCTLSSQKIDYSTYNFSDYDICEEWLLGFCFKSKYDIKNAVDRVDVKYGRSCQELQMLLKSRYTPTNEERVMHVHVQEVENTSSYIDKSTKPFVASIEILKGVLSGTRCFGQISISKQSAKESAALNLYRQLNVIFENASTDDVLRRFKMIKSNSENNTHSSIEDLASRPPLYDAHHSGNNDDCIMTRSKTAAIKVEQSTSSDSLLDAKSIKERVLRWEPRAAGRNNRSRLSELLQLCYCRPMGRMMDWVKESRTVSSNLEGEGWDGGNKDKSQISTVLEYRAILLVPIVGLKVTSSWYSKYSHAQEAASRIGLLYAYETVMEERRFTSLDAEENYDANTITVKHSNTLDPNQSTNTSSSLTSNFSQPLGLANTNGSPENSLSPISSECSESSKVGEDDHSRRAMDNYQLVIDSIDRFGFDPMDVLHHVLSKVWGVPQRNVHSHIDIQELRSDDGVYKYYLTLRPPGNKPGLDSYAAFASRIVARSMACTLLLKRLCESTPNLNVIQHISAAPISSVDQALKIEICQVDGQPPPASDFEEFKKVDVIAATQRKH